MIPIIAFARANWKLIGIGLLLLALGYQTLTKRTALAQRDQARSTISSMNEQTVATAKRWKAKAATLEAKAVAIRKDTSNEIASINADRDAALVELRTRPSRSTPASTTTIAGTCTTPLGGSGAFLFREDSAFLIGEAARADRVRVSLKDCYAQYDNARDSLAEER